MKAKNKSSGDIEPTKKVVQFTAKSGKTSVKEIIFPTPPEGDDAAAGTKTMPTVDL